MPTAPEPTPTTTPVPQQPAPESPVVGPGPDAELCSEEEIALRKQKTLAKAHVVLGGLGMFPLAGALFDTADFVLCLANEEYGGAILSLVSLIPVIGEVSGYAKTADKIADIAKIVDTVDDIHDTTNVIEGVVTVAEFADDVSDTSKAISNAEIIVDAVDDVTDAGKIITGSTRTLIDDSQSIVDDIIDINKQYSNGYEMNNSVSNIVSSASYCDSEYDQVSSIVRSITQHAFENGNKRTAFDTLNMLLNDFDLACPLTDAQKWNLINSIAEGDIKDVTEISRLLQGK